MDWLVLTATEVTTQAVNTTGQQGYHTNYAVLFNIISLLVCIGIPTVFILLGILKYEGSFKMTLWGIVGYVIFTTMLYAIVSRVILAGYKDQESTAFEAVLLIVVRVVCEVLGMFAILKFTSAKRRGLGNAMLMGAAYCLMECLIVVVVFLVPYLMLLTSGDEVERIAVFRTLRVFDNRNNLVPGEEWKFLAQSLTALVFSALQMSGAIVTAIAVYTKKYWYVGIPVIYGIAIRVPNRLQSYDAWFWGNNAVIMPYLGIMAVIISVVTYVLWKKNKGEPGFGHIERKEG